MQSIPAGRRTRPVLPRAGTTKTSPGPSSARGFTLLEVLFVVMIAVITLGVASQVYADYTERTATRNVARIFSRDLTLARMNAVQTRESVIIRFDEPARNYVVVRASGQEVTTRSYGADADVTLSEIDLEMPGDSVVFNGRGVADLSAVTGSLGTATFRIGSETYLVSFNSMGASRVTDT